MRDDPCSLAALDGNLPVALVVLAVDGTIERANDLAAEMLGASRQALAEENLLDRLARADRQAVLDALARVHGDESGSSDSQVVSVAATLESSSPAMPIELTMRRVPHQADPNSDSDVASVAPSTSSTSGAVVVTLRSRVSEHRLESIIDAMADSTMLLDADGLVVWQSHRLASRAPRGIGVNPLERLHPEDLPGVLDAWTQTVAHEGQVIRHRARSRAVEDDDVWQTIEVVGSSHLNDPRLRAIVVQIRNLDEGEMIESVGEADGRFNSLADAAPIGIVVTDAHDRTIYRNASARDLLEQPELSPHQDWRDFVRPAFAREFAVLRTDAAAQGREATLTAAFDLPSGASRWLRVNVTPRFIDGQQGSGLITTLEDVTAEVEARSETERLKHMLDATSDYVAIFRPDGEVLYVNQATQGLLDALAAEGGSRELAELIDDEPRERWIAAGLEVLEHTDVWQGELPLNIGGGRTIVVSALGVISRLPDGELDWVAVLGRDISELKAAEERLRTLATHDHLTGLPNRALFTDRLALAIARHQRGLEGVAVMFCDLDGFKEINDEHGHANGDVVLLAVADRLRDITRLSDTAARVGGDEFVVVVEGLVDNDELATLAERVIEAVGRPIELSDGASVRPGISVGVAVAGSHVPAVGADALLTLADTAMYRAKARGGNTFRIAAVD